MSGWRIAEEQRQEQDEMLAYLAQRGALKDDGPGVSGGAFRALGLLFLVGMIAGGAWVAVSAVRWLWERPLF